MSQLVNGATHLISNGAAPIAGYPFTFFIEFQLLNHLDGLAHGLMQTALTTGNGDYLYGFVSTTGVVSAKAQNTAGTNKTATAGTVTDENWHRLVVLGASATSLIAALDNVQGTADTTSISPTGFDRFTFGAFRQQGGALFDNVGHRIGRSGVWNAVLGADDLLRLQLGIDPRKIAPANLKCAPSFRKDAWDPIQQVNFTVTGAVVDSSRLRGPDYSSNLLGA